MNWEAFEKEIFEELKRRHPGVPIAKNVKIPGRITHRKRQVDVLIETQLLDSPIRVIVDAKHRRDPIDVKDVEAFIGLMSDVDAHRGILISTNGYTATAIARAHNQQNQDIELDIYSLAELKSFQMESAIPYSGNRGVILEAPFGWVIDNLPRPGVVACLYQRGHTIDTAYQAHEWMYLNFWKKESPGKTLDDLLDEQKKGFQKRKLKARLSILHGVDRADAVTCIRLAEVPTYPALEYTGFVEFHDFVFFAVLLTPQSVLNRNLKKLREILRNVKPIEIRNEAKKLTNDDFISRQIAGDAALDTPDGQKYMEQIWPYLENAIRNVLPPERASPSNNCSFEVIAYITEMGQVTHADVNPSTDISVRIAKEFALAWLPPPPKNRVGSMGFPITVSIRIKN